MLWLEHLRKDPAAYHDFVAFLGDQKRLAEGQFLHAKDMEQVNKIKGRVEGMIGFELIATQHEREEADAAERATQRERAHAGLSAVR